MSTVITKRFILCPACGKSEHGIEHLVPNAQKYGFYGFGPWSCDADDCDAMFAGRVQSDGTVTDVVITRREKPRGLALLKFRDLYLVLEERYGRVTSDHADFFYHSHQCPTNLLRKVHDVFAEDGSCDPHGRLRFIANIDDTPEAREALGNVDSASALFEVFDTSGEEPETEWPERDGGMLPFIAEWQRDAGRKP